MEDLKNKIILDLCGGTGSWSRPYEEAGYDLRNITLPDYDVRTYKPPENVYGILAAPPCTMFSYARTNAKKLRDLKEGMECVRACLDIIWSFLEVKQPTAKKTLPLKFWALENPYYGFLSQFIGKPAFTFDPWEFGDGYQKRTSLWGNFNEPTKTPVKMSAKAKAKTNSYLHLLKLPPERFTANAPLRYKVNGIPTTKVKFDYLKSKDIHPEVFGKFDRQTRRSITPAGFSKAFFLANQ